MKTKFILTSFLILFVSLFNEGIFAYAFRCDEVEKYCNYQGMYANLDGAQEEFQMLLEPPRHANFQQMFSVLLYIHDCGTENQDCIRTLKNPDCNISKYTQKLIAFYDDNKENINDKFVVDMIEFLKKIEES